MKTLKQLLKQYEVKIDFSYADSNLVYPCDVGSKYVREGYTSEDEILTFLKRCAIEISSDYVPTRIANKYAIPFLQCGYMHTLKTYFYYQHDDKTWVISLTENTKEYIS